MSFRILVTCAGGALVPHVIRLLKEHSRHRVSVVAVDTRHQPVAAALADTFAVVPPGNDPAYVDRIAALSEAERVDLVLPWSDEEALALAGARDRIERDGRLLACAPVETLRLMSDKLESLEKLRQAGVPVPDWTLASTADELAAAIADWSGRGDGFVVKPLRSRGGRDVLVVEPGRDGLLALPGHRELYLGPDAFAAHVAEHAPALPVLVMERLTPAAWDIDVLTWGGKVLRCAPRRRVNPSGIPFEGSVLDGRTDLFDIAGRVAQALNLSWMYDIDLMTGTDGAPRVIELNPRPSGSLAAVAALGVPIFDDLISVAKGESLPDIAPLWGATALPYTSLSVVP